MFIRRAETAVETYPEREASDDMALCPPHAFEAGWCSPVNAQNHDDTVPGLFCSACGDIRPFRLSE